MTTRTFFKSLAALAMSPLAVLGRKPVPPPIIWLDQTEWREWPEKPEKMKWLISIEWHKPTK